MTPSTPSLPSAGAARDLGEAVARHRAALWRYARVLGADGPTADDLVQEAMLVAIRRPAFAADDAPAVFAFLRTTARHLWLKDVRRRRTRREVEHADEVWDRACGGGGGGGEYVDALRRCVADLPSRSRRLLEATYVDGAGRSGAARALGMTENGVKSALRRLRTALHRCIERRTR